MKHKHTSISSESKITAGILGLAVGDALGVPVEFCSRKELQKCPVAEMRGYGSHHQPPGTWSDDTSLTLCLVESLCHAGVDFHDQARRFIGWLLRDQWTPRGEVFDVGISTREAIFRMHRGTDPLAAGLQGEFNNGNGSLMRILPVALYLAKAEPAERMKASMMCSRLTHGYPRSQIACAMYVEIAAALVSGLDIEQAVLETQQRIAPLISDQPAAEQAIFSRLLSPQIGELSESAVSGSGYVIHCLEASVWCAVRAKTYTDGVLQALNLGDDSDTTGAVAGGLLGLRFGLESIPETWTSQLARRDEIFYLCNRFEGVCQHRWILDQQHKGGAPLL